jgi:hypothetical protein
MYAGGYNFCIMMHWYEWVTWGGNIALAAVGTGGILVAVRTLKKIERQTKATEDQARYLTTSDRAWIIVSSRFHSLPPKDIDAGKTSKDLISYGYIKYLDIFGQEHTTRFCQSYWVDPRNILQKARIAVALG